MSVREGKVVNEISGLIVVVLIVAGLIYMNNSKPLAEESSQSSKLLMESFDRGFEHNPARARLEHQAPSSANQKTISSTIVNEEEQAGIEQKQLLSSFDKGL